MPRRREPKKADPRRVKLREIVRQGRHLERGRFPVTAGRLAKAVGTTRGTLLRWMQADFPSIYEAHYLPFTDLMARSLSQGPRTSPPTMVPLPDPSEAANEELEPEYSRRDLIDPLRTHLKDL